MSEGVSVGDGKVSLHLCLLLQQITRHTWTKSALTNTDLMLKNEGKKGVLKSGVSPFGRSYTVYPIFIDT